MSEAATTKPCPFCGKPIKSIAIKCRHCGEYLDEDDDYDDRPRGGGDASADEGLKFLLPIGRSGWAIASGYLGLLSCFPLVGFLFGILAIVTAILALRASKRNPKLGGRGRAIFGMIAGGIAGLANLALIVALLVRLAAGK